MNQKSCLLAVVFGMSMLGGATAWAMAEDPHFALATGVTTFSEPRARTEAVALVQGNEFAVASSSGYPDSTPTHFHSDDSDSYGVGTDWMEVGECCDGESGEEVRGMAEFDITSSWVVDSAMVRFEVVQTSGLFSQPGPGDFNVELIAYEGNYAEDMSDYSAMGTAVVAFNTAALTVDDFFYVDVTDEYNAAVGAAATGFGIRLQPTSSPGGAALVFGNAELTLASDPPPPPPQEEPVPVNTPTALMVLLLVVLIAGFLAVRRRTVA